MQNSLLIKILGVVIKNDVSSIHKRYKKLWLFLIFEISKTLC